MPHPALKMKPARREKLFAAATREFTGHGFEQASLNRIIAEVGMSKSSFYHYFANKTELFQQIILQTVAPLAKMVEAFRPEDLTRETFWPGILALSKASNVLYVNQPEIFNVGRMFHRNLHAPSGICDEMMRAPLALLTRLLEHGKVIGAIRDDLPTSLLIETAMGMGIALDRWAVDNTEHYSKAEFEAFTEKIVSLFIRLLAPED
jgi:AcrR family transcriptional regulator